jgi:hypothetical protein
MHASTRIEGDFQIPVGSWHSEVILPNDDLRAAAKCM